MAIGWVFFLTVVPVGIGFPRQFSAFLMKLDIEATVGTCTPRFWLLLCFLLPALMQEDKG